MKRLLVFSVVVFMLNSIQAQNKFEQDRQAIKSMEGCYKVTFNFAETFSPDSAYVKHENYKSWAYELAKVIEDEPNHISLQHLLIVNEDKDPMVIKHWRQDWDYENTQFHMFHQANFDTKGQEWKYVAKTKEDVKGQWSQKVFQVDDSPRYEGSATWVHYDDRHYWENKTDAPLPRREYSKRHDYNVTERTNHIEIENYGWVHEQDNAKVLRTEDGDKVIAYEKGMNTYVKVADSICQPAEEWWNENQEIWKNVRSAWKNKYNEKKDLYLWPKTKMDVMYRDFFGLEKGATVEEASDIIEKFSK